MDAPAYPSIRLSIRLYLRLYTSTRSPVCSWVKTFPYPCVRLYVCLYFRLSVKSVRLYVRPQSVITSVYTSDYTSVDTPVYMSLYTSVYISVYTSVYIRPSTCPSSPSIIQSLYSPVVISLSVRTYAYLSFCLSIGRSARVLPCVVLSVRPSMRLKSVCLSPARNTVSCTFF